MQRSVLVNRHTSYRLRRRPVRATRDNARLVAAAPRVRGRYLLYPGARTTAGAQHGDGAPGTTARDLGAIKSAARAAFAHQVHDQVGLGRAEPAARAVAVVGAIH